MSKKRATFAKAGDVEALLGDFKSSKQGQYELYQWLEVTGDLGSDEADELAESLLEAELCMSSEVLATAHFEVGEWWLLGQNHLEVHQEFGLHHLRYALVVAKPEATARARALRPKLSGATLTKFNRLFPPKKGKEAKKAKKVKSAR